jgi:spore coat protein CotH
MMGTGRAFTNLGAVLMLALLAPACGGGGGGGSSESSKAASNAVFDDATFATYTLTISDLDWTYIQNGDKDTWRTADLTWQGETVTKVAVRAANSPPAATFKPSIRFKFDEFVPDRKWRSLNHLNLDSMVDDKTFLRERIGLWTHRMTGVPAPRSVHARLVVNGNSLGVYEVREEVRKAFAEYHWGNNDGNLYEIQKNETVVGFDSYAWRGSDPATYVPSIWEPKTNETGGVYGDVVALLDVFNNAPAASRRAQLDTLIDLSDFLAYLAVSTAIADPDGLTGEKGPNNHYWYHREDNNTMEIVAWDPDKSLGYPQLDGVFNANFGLWTRFSQSAATSWIQAEATASTTYQNKVRKVFDEAFSVIGIQIDYVYNQIKDAVYLDPYKPMTDAEFDQAPAKLKQWIDNRRAYLDTVLPARPSPLAGDNAGFVSQSGVPTSMSAGQTVTVSITMTNTGTTTWTEAGEYKLTSRANRNNLLWGDNRIKVPAGTSIAPGASFTFTFPIVAPRVPGTYNFQWSMVNDSFGGGGAVFGATSPLIAVLVN